MNLLTSGSSESMKYVDRQHKVDISVTKQSYTLKP